MTVGVPREIKRSEYRVGMVPAGVRALTEKGHRVVVEKGAGEGSSIPDSAFKDAGAEVVGSAEEVYREADLVVKVKEPQDPEVKLLREGQVVFTFFHLAAHPELADGLLSTGVTAVAYETVETESGALPILAPMSEVAGRVAVQAGAHHLMKPYGGRGVLPGGVPGVARAEFVILGAGTVGCNAARIAAGLGSEVTVLDIDPDKLRRLEDLFGSRVRTLYSNTHNTEKCLQRCDLLVGAVHRAGARTPTLVTREMLSLMPKNSVIVDVSVDQGGCVETIRPTTHDEPVYEVDGVIHYGVANMPGAVPRTSTYALTGATLPFVLKLAGGFNEAIEADPALKNGVNIHRGRVTHPSVAESLDKNFTELD